MEEINSHVIGPITFSRDTSIDPTNDFTASEAWIKEMTHIKDFFKNIIGASDQLRHC